MKSKWIGIRDQPWKKHYENNIVPHFTSNLVIKKLQVICLQFIYLYVWENILALTF